MLHNSSDSLQLFHTKRFIKTESATVVSNRVHISLTKWGYSALIQIEV